MKRGSPTGLPLKKADRSMDLSALFVRNYLWIRPEPSPPASFSTSATVTML